MSEDRESQNLYRDLEAVLNKYTSKDILLLEVLGCLDLLARCVHETTNENDSGIDEISDKPWL